MLVPLGVLGRVADGELRLHLARFLEPELIHILHRIESTTFFKATRPEYRTRSYAPEMRFYVILIHRYLVCIKELEEYARREFRQQLEDAIDY